MLHSMPAIEVTAGGAQLDEAAIRSLVEVTVVAEVGCPAAVELCFVEPPLRHPLGWPRAAEALEVRIGGVERPLFTGRVTAIEHEWLPDRGRVLRVRGHDALHALRRRRTPGAARPGRLSDLARALGASLGVPVAVHGDGPAQRDEVRRGESDLVRLRDLADRTGCGFSLDGDTLRVFDAKGYGDAVALTLGETLWAARATADLGRLHRQVIADGWDPATVTTARGESAGVKGRALDDAPLWLVEHGVGDAEALVARAEGVGAHQAAAALVLEGTAAGDVRLVPGRRIAVGGLDASADGIHVITRVTHIVDGEAGFHTRFDTAWPTLRAPAPSAEVTPAVVTEVDDPERRGRVRVRLPTLGDAETGWLSVAAPGLGVGKGLVTTPDIGDAVLVLFDAGHPGRGIVLGGLAVHPLPEDGLAGGRVSRTGLYGRLGHRVVLDDAARRIEVTHAGGGSLTLSDDTVLLDSTGTLILEAPRIVIRGRAVDFERLP